MARRAVIAPLTGVRLLAALWVVCFHVYLYNGDQLAADHPAVNAVVGPVVSQGDLGVDLFFLLSGFVLAHNYLERLGARPSAQAAVSFLWMRISRIWPLYLVAVLGGGLLLWLRLQWWGSEPNVPLSWSRFLAQVLMIQQWSAPNVPNTSWTGPAWSISAEWLAYLFFPLLAVAVWSLRRRASRAVLLTLACATLVPTMTWTAVAHTQAAPYMWLGRLASEFTCGMLLSAGLPGDRSRARRAGWLAPASVVLAVTWLYVADRLHQPSLGPLVLGVFPLFVLALAVGDGPLQRWLGTRPMVLGGGASFALYLVHVPLLKLFRDAREHGWVPLSASGQIIGELGVVMVSGLLAYLLFRHLEEPARHWLRDLEPQLPEPDPRPAPFEMRWRLTDEAALLASMPADVTQQARRVVC